MLKRNLEQQLIIEVKKLEVVKYLQDVIKDLKVFTAWTAKKIRYELGDEFTVLYETGNTAFKVRYKQLEIRWQGMELYDENMYFLGIRQSEIDTYIALYTQVIEDIRYQIREFQTLLEIDEIAKREFLSVYKRVKQIEEKYQAFPANLKTPAIQQFLNSNVSAWLSDFFDDERLITYCVNGEEYKTVVYGTVEDINGKVNEAITKLFAVDASTIIVRVE